VHLLYVIQADTELVAIARLPSVLPLSATMISPGMLCSFSGFWLCRCTSERDLPREGVMIETSGKSLSVAGVSFAIASIGIGVHAGVSSPLRQIIGHHATATKFFLRVALVLETISNVDQRR
jgi:hypothetical protein